MKVGLLTEQQKDLLIEAYYERSSLFNPIQDADENWIISLEEINNCINEKYMWVKELPLIEFKEI